MNNLFNNIPDSLAEELVEVLVEAGNVRVERIVSRGHASPPDFWYEQATDEWVAVLRGEGRLQFEGEPDIVEMNPGDWIHIPAHRRHRVEETSAMEATVWLAVHFPPAV